MKNHYSLFKIVKQFRFLNVKHRLGLLNNLSIYIWIFIFFYKCKF